MAEFVFPEIKAHYATVNGWNLIFNTWRSSVLHTDLAGFDFIQHCSGMTLERSKIWLQERYGEASVGVAENLKRIIDAGYFAEPEIDNLHNMASTPPLINFSICTTHRCNMRCSYCFASHLRKSKAPKDMSSDTAHAAIDFIFDVLQPPWAVLSLGITGEPQLRWDAIADTMEYAKRRSEDTGIGVSFHVTTNGLETNKQMLDYLHANDDLGITLSWDGPPEIHNRQRLALDGSQTYESVSNTFDVLRSTTRSRPLVTATVSALDPDITGVFAHLYDKGVRDLTLKPTRSVGPEHL